MAASPRSASQTSPGLGVIEQVQHFLFALARTGYIKRICVGKVDHFSDTFAHVGGRLRLPCAQSRVKFSANVSIAVLQSLSSHPAPRLRAVVQSIRHLHGMVIGMATAKVTITLGEDQLEEIRALVAAGQARNTSAFVQHAVKIALQDAAGWALMLDEALQRTGGPLTAKERAWADSVLSPRKKNAKKRTAA